MASLASAIAYEIVNDTNISAITDKIYSSKAPETTTGTYIVYKIIDGGPMTDANPVTDDLCQITLYGDSISTVRNLREKVCNLFNTKSEDMGATGSEVPVIGATIQNRGVELYDDSTKKWTISIDVFFEYMIL